MSIKKITYILMVTLLLLTACSKAETKGNTQKTGIEKDEDKSQTDETLGKKAEVSSDDVENIADEEQTDSVQASNDDNNKSNETQSNDTTTDNSSDTQTSTTKPTTGNTTPQKPTSGSNSQATQKEEVKLVDRIREEVPGTVTEYKYGITQKVTVTNDYYVYSDGSKKLVDSVSSTSYDPAKYEATDSQLKAEADTAASKYMNYYQEVLRLVNEIRAEVGVAPLTLNTTMCQAASMRAIEMDYKSELSHTRPNASSCFSALDFYGVSYSTAGENIAMGYSSPTSVVNGWRNSQGHYENMINPNYTQLGVGYSNMQLYGNTPYWVQFFAK